METNQFCMSEKESSTDCVQGVIFPRKHPSIALTSSGGGIRCDFRDKFLTRLQLIKLASEPESMNTAMGMEGIAGFQFSLDLVVRWVI